MKKLLICTMLLIISSMSGCVSPEQTTYVLETDNGESVLLLDGDGTYLVSPATSDPFYGEYVIIDDILYLKYIVLGTPTAIKLQITDDVLIDEDGDRWIKTSRASE